MTSGSNSRWSLSSTVASPYFLPRRGRRRMYLPSCLECSQPPSALGWCFAIPGLPVRSWSMALAQISLRLALVLSVRTALVGGVAWLRRRPTGLQSTCRTTKRRPSVESYASPSEVRRGTLDQRCSISPAVCVCVARGEALTISSGVVGLSAAIGNQGGRGVATLEAIPYTMGELSLAGSQVHQRRSRAHYRRLPIPGGRHNTSLIMPIGTA